MRFGRVVFLAGLAPLLGLAAAFSAQPSSDAATQVAAIGTPDTLSSLLRSVVFLVSAETAGEQSTTREHQPSPQWVLELHALEHTPLEHSIWMVSRPLDGELPVRPPLLFSLRC